MRELSSIKGFGPKRLEALAKRGIESAKDLLETLPTGYRDTTSPMSPVQMTDGTTSEWIGERMATPSIAMASR